MKAVLSSRSWHIWVSLILSLPILIVGLTAVFIAHNKTWGLDKIHISAGWLPGYSGAEASMESAEIRSSLVTQDGVQWIGSKMGLYAQQGEAWQFIKAIGQHEVRSLLEVKGQVLAASKNGIWLGNINQPWQQVYKGDSWGATLDDTQQVTVAIKDRGLVMSSDLVNWTENTTLQNSLINYSSAQNTTGKVVTLHNLVMDLHTGKAFFGKTFEWIWIDLIGLAMVLLSLTGVYMWWRTQQRKKALL